MFMNNKSKRLPRAHITKGRTRHAYNTLTFDSPRGTWPTFTKKQVENATCWNCGVVVAPDYPDHLPKDDMPEFKIIDAGYPGGEGRYYVVCAHCGFKNFFDLKKED